jgi:hypothetical protein
MAELLGIIANEGNNCIPATARFGLAVLAGKYAAIAAEIGTIEKHIHCLAPLTLWSRTTKQASNSSTRAAGSAELIASLQEA